jgi:hypothetical protein
MRRNCAAFAAMVLMLCLTACAQAGENLLKDPSFENAKPRDNNGLVFADWQGNIYEGQCQFDVGLVAHTGQRSCQMTSDRGKIRVFSPELDLQPGRYRMSAWLRGLDVASTGSMGNYAMDVCADGATFLPLRVDGTFDWRPLHLVFEIKEAKKAKVFIGLCASGKVWVDDVALEKVDANTELTPQVVLDAGAKPITPPGELGDKPSKCRACGSKNNSAWPHCYACGAELRATKFSTPAVMTFIELNDAGIAPFETSDGGVASIKKTPAGDRAIFLEKGWVEVSKVNGKFMDWTQHELVHIDVFNPSDKAANAYVEVRDATSTDYQSRVNIDTTVAPGKSTITFPTTMYTNEKAHPGRPLDPKEIHRFVLSSGTPPLYFYNLRVERLDTANVTFDELRALAFGPPDAPVCEGFEKVSGNSPYSSSRGFGWIGAEIWREFNARQPDTLTQSFACVQDGAFHFDLPNGKYHVYAIIDSPGGFWGEVQFYKERAVTLNGKPWIHETMDFKEAKRRFFQNAMHEDLPGADPFEAYVNPKLPWRHAIAEVTDGKLDIKFNSADKYGWTFCLSTLVVYPDSKAKEGERFMKWVDERRRIQFHDYFKEVAPRLSGAPAPKDGYSVFARNFMTSPASHDGPEANETIGAQGLTALAAQGEEVPVAFSLQPGTAQPDLGPIDIQVSPMKTTGGATLDASALTPGWLSYRIARITAEGTSYGVGPRYWHPTPTLAAPGVTRTFWVRAKIPASATPGEYKGTITIKPQHGASHDIPLTLNVLPFKLDPITDVAVGPWGCAIGVPWYGTQYTAPIDNDLSKWNEKLFEDSLDVLHEAGCTSLSGLPTLSVKAKDGKFELNAERADEEMKLLRANGFTQLISSYGVEGLGYNPYGDNNGPDEATAKSAGFPNAAAFIKTLYKEIDDHAVKHDWNPVAWNLCDEPSGAAVPGAVKNALAHRQAHEGLKRTTFMGATSMEGNDPKDPHFDLIKALPIPSLNLHDEKSLAVVHEAGNQFSFYNGGSRWTYGRYLKMLVKKHGLVLRLSWHYNANAGDPYYALDCREDDYCWYNSDAEGRMVPSVGFLANIMPGIYDYRYLSTLERLLKEKPEHPAAKSAQEVFQRMIALEAGKDREPKADYAKDRAELANAIESLLK